MIEMRRPIRPLVSLAALVLLPAAVAHGQSAGDSFQRGVEALNRGETSQALEAFQEVLAMDLSHEEAYELWQSTSHDVWLKLLSAGGQVELHAKDMMLRATRGRRERSADEGAIRELLGQATSDDVVARRTAVAKLTADHGEYAVPYMVHTLGNQNDADKRVLVMQALTHMGDDVVLPLIAALDSPDAYMRRNVALTLGYIGDPQASAALAERAFGDDDTGVRNAAAQSLERLGGTSDAGAQFLDLADAYYAEDGSVLAPTRYSNVVWDWDGSGLAATEIPRFLYAPELAKRAYLSGLAADPSSTRALAGLARCVVTQRSRIEEWAAMGQDASDWGPRVEADGLAVQLAGAEALDLALGWALDQDDQAAAAGLCRALGGSATAATANLSRALASASNAAVRGEAAMALALVGSTDASTVDALVEAASRRVRQIVAVIDGDGYRAEELGKSLEARGLVANVWTSGARGLAALRSVPGIDAVIVASELPDMTFAQVIDNLDADPRTAETPVLVIGSDADVAGADGNINASDLSALDDALSGSLGRDRDQANALAGRASRVLWQVASKGVDISGSAGTLASALEGGPDAVIAPTLAVLGMAGGQNEVDSIAAVLADGARQAQIRVVAADALAAIFGRTGMVSQSAIDAVRGVATSDGPGEVRGAAARALGRLDLSGEVRSELIRGVRGL